LETIPQLDGRRGDLAHGADIGIIELPGLEAAREVNVEHVDDQPLTGTRLAEPPEKKTFDFTQRRLLRVLAVVLAKTGVGVICGNRGILPSSRERERRPQPRSRSPRPHALGFASD
jgi:hypothetical protein